MGLKEYKKKRDFKETPEPKAALSKEDKARFVVQRHQASSLHYDLRLEIEGVLKSWAVPKGPSMHPGDKRLAIHTEDHPVSYLSFEGVIPKGNYGAGEMHIWDSGTFETGGDDEDAEKSLADGKLSFILNGKKLKGAFTLVRSSSANKKNQWLLIKKKDAYATDLKYDAEEYIPEKAPSASPPRVRALKLNKPISPMLASPGKEVFNHPGWLYELKYDGYRSIAMIKDGTVELYSRNGISFNKKFAGIYNELQAIEHDVVLDGEIVVVDKKGVPQFQALQNYDPDTTPGTLQFFVFDMLHLNGHDMHSLPLKERKSLIPELVEPLSHVLYSDHIEGMGKALFEKALKMGMEGIIAKKADSRYSPGYRSEDWLKLKKTESMEAIICGYTVSDKAGRPLGSLILGMWDQDTLTYVGNCGTGFSQAGMKALAKQFELRTRKTSPFPEKINLKGREPVWLKPELLCEVSFTEWTKTRMMRHPVFKGLREDKTLPEAIVEQKGADIKKPKALTPADDSLEINGIAVPITHPDKVYWPDEGLTKFDLLNYYIQMGEVMMPYLKDRPQNLHRHPNGITKPGFYQKDHEHNPDWVETIALHSESADKDINYLLCQNEATLLYMANLGCIEINPWHSTVQDLDHPTYSIIDLDPSPKNTFSQIIETALVAKEVLDKAGVTGFCKTSGSRGLHIYLPLGGDYTYEEALAFTKVICHYVRKQLPKLTTMERTVKKRGNKIYLDCLQNSKGQTIVAPYSARPKKGATVSTPLQWSEVKKGLDMNAFTIHTVPARIAKMGDLFAPVLTTALDMEAAMEKLEE